MPPTENPMLTKREVEAIDDSDPQREQKARNTIEAAMELLERWTKIGPYFGVLHDDTDAILRAYHGTGTSEQEGGGA